MTTQTNNPTDSVSASEAETESSITIYGVGTGNNETYTARINLNGTLESWVPSHSPPNPDAHISTAGITETAADTYTKIAHIPNGSPIYVSPDAYSNRVAITANRPVAHRERFDSQYRDIIAEILLDGITQGNRTGEPSRWIPTATVKVDLQKEFPILNLRKIYPKQAIGEMLGFLRGYTNSQHFEELGCKYWHANANLPTKGSDTSPWLSSRHRLGKNDLGEIYGDLWRHWVGDDGMVVDQVADVVDAIHRTPDSRRILVTGWKPESVKQVRGALPPCHVLWQVMVDTQKRELHLSWTQRSVDAVLGAPSNMVGYAFLLALLARVTGYTPRTVTGHLNQVHIYESHLKAAELLRSRLLDSPVSRLVFNETTAPRPDPVFMEPCGWFLRTCDHSHYEIQNYHPQEAIPGLVMAV